MSTEAIGPAHSSPNRNQLVIAPKPGSSHDSAQQAAEVGGSRSSGSTTNVRKRQGPSSRRSPNRQGSDRHRNLSGSSTDILRRVRLFQQSGALTLTYADVARAEDRTLLIFNQDPELLKTCGTGIDVQTFTRLIDADVAVEIVGRLEGDEKIPAGTLDGFNQWLNILSRETEVRASLSGDFKTPSDRESRVFLTWYPEPRSEGYVQTFSPRDDVPGLSRLIEHLSVMEGVTHNSGWLCLMTSQRDIERNVQRDVEPSMNNVETALIGDHPSLLFYVAPPTTDDPYLGQQTSAIYSSEWDWVGNDQPPLLNQFQPYVTPFRTPFGTHDPFSPNVVRIWSPVLGSAQRAENYVTRIGTQFENLFQSRYRFYYDVNLSTIPVPGTYSYFRPV